MIKAFVSCSNHPTDNYSVTRFKNILQNCHFAPYTIGQEIQVGDEEVEFFTLNSVHECDCVIVFATSRSYTVDGKKIMPEALHSEIALARSYDKPVIVFIEEGVEFHRGLMPYFYQFKPVFFDRNKLNFDDPQTCELIFDALLDFYDAVVFSKNQHRNSNFTKILFGAFATIVIGTAIYQIGKNSSCESV